MMMIGVFVTFQYGDDFDRGKVEAIAREAVPGFEGLAGLRLKAFTVDEAERRAVNFYLWESREAAEGFFTPALGERVTGLYGTAPSISFVEVPAFADNSLEVPAMGPA
jgi:hypothetical protein